MLKITNMKQSDIKEVRDKLLIKQNNLCAIRKKPINNPVLDHEHKKGLGGTGFIRAVLDREVNQFLGKIENNARRNLIALDDLPEVLRQIADYLEQEYYCEDGYFLLHPSEVDKEPRLKKSSYNKLKKIYKGRAKFPLYPKTAKLTKALEKLFKVYKLEPEFYS